MNLQVLPGNGSVYMACSQPETNIEGFISHPISAASLARSASDERGFQQRTPEFLCPYRNLLSVSWQQQPPKFGERLGLHGPTAGLSRISGVSSPTLHQQGHWHRSVCNRPRHRNPVYAERNLVSASWPEQPPNLVCGLDYMACSRRDSNIGGFISRPPSAAYLAPDRNRAPESCVRRLEFGERFLVGAATGIWCTAWVTKPAADRSRITAVLSPTLHQQHRWHNSACNKSGCAPLHSFRHLHLLHDKRSKRG